MEHWEREEVRYEASTCTTRGLTYRLFQYTASQASPDFPHVLHLSPASFCKSRPRSLPGSRGGILRRLWRGAISLTVSVYGNRSRKQSGTLGGARKLGVEIGTVLDHEAC